MSEMTFIIIAVICGIIMGLGLMVIIGLAVHSAFTWVVETFGRK